MKLVNLNTFDNKTNTVCVWDEVENVIGAVVISHGMAEHAERYDDFAKFLNKNGYVVLGDNHRGHKYNPDGEKGIVDGDSFHNTVKDALMVVEYAKSKYNVEVLLLGHSYGSFVSQRYLELYSETIKGCILSGTAYMKGALIGAGCAIAGMQKALCGAEKTGYLIDKMSFGAYNKPFESQGQQFAWLSRDKEQVAKYENDEYCGYPLSIGYYHSFFKGVMGMYGEAVDTISKELPILIAVGSDDPVSNKSVLATKLYNFYNQKGMNVEYKVYENARHEILNETNNQEVYEDFLNFINKVYA